MQYNRIKEGKFISRPNRFIANIELEGKTEVCHVKNTGRCRELLVPGARVLVEEAENPDRKTKYDLVQVYKGEVLVNMDSQMPNYLVREFLEKGEFFPELTALKMEQTYGNSRFDLYAEYQGRKAFIEVKGVTLEENGAARFPDAPTTRGVKHIKELEQCLKDGYEAWIFFVIQMKGVHTFRPNWSTHPEFGEALQKAQEAGVQVQAWDCRVEPGEIHIDRKIPVDLRRDIQ
ncbi:MAG: DNA/RNA nuclease SfsA [Clostridiales bacterium]|nr:DNA/RNA nuclease SfsA [Clostridiales bacterium]